MPRLPAHERDDDLNQASNDPHETEGVGVLVTEALASAHSARRSFTDWCQQQHVEHMALTRARVISGPDALVAKVNDTICSVLSMPRNPDRLLADVDSMRQRLAEEFSRDNPWHVKHVRGGLVDAGARRARRGARRGTGRTSRPRPPLRG